MTIYTKPRLRLTPAEERAADASSPLEQIAPKGGDR